MSATEATADIFVTAFKALMSDAELADDLADTLALEARRQQPHSPLRGVLKNLQIRV